MKKAINILFLVSKILSILVAVTYVVLAVVSFVQAGTGPSADSGARIGDGVRYIFQISFAVVAIYLAFTREESIVNVTERAQYNAIFCIVFGVLGSTPTLAAAGIVGLILRAQQNQAKPTDAEVIDEPKDNE